jgi:hypothetical protein
VCLPGYRGDNLRENQDANPLAIPFALVYQVSRRRLVSSVANLGELFANAAKPGGELKLWDVRIGREVSTLRRGIRPIGLFTACRLILRPRPTGKDTVSDVDRDLL